jgi:phage gp46-like protein
MPDISTIWVVDLSLGDYALQGAALRAGDDLVTAILLSLFTDRQAAADDVIPDGSDDARGWWGDLAAPRPIGSRLWLLEREKELPQVLVRAAGYVDEALQWLIDDGVVARFDRVVEFTRPGMLGIKIVAFERDGTILTNQFYQYAWAQLKAA